MVWGFWWGRSLRWTPQGNEKVPLNRRTETWEPGPYGRIVPKLFEHLRKGTGARLRPLILCGVTTDIERPILVCE